MVDRDKPTVVINDPHSERIPSVVISENFQSEEDEEELKEKPNVEKAVKGGVNFFFDFLETIVVALSIFVVVYLFLVQPHEVKGSSMEPNFHNNEYILTDKISYRFSLPKRGDVIIFKAPSNPDVDYIKRVIGTPGDRVKVEGGSVYVNDRKLEEPYLRDATTLFPGSKLTEGMDITVDQNYYFVLGDNRPHSSDSREFGPISKTSIVGKAFFRYWPVSEFGILPHMTYSQ
jgi:signal peptidase I